METSRTPFIPGQGHGGLGHVLYGSWKGRTSMHPSPWVSEHQQLSRWSPGHRINQPIILSSYPHNPNAAVGHFFPFPTRHYTHTRTCHPKATMQGSLMSRALRLWICESELSKCSSEKNQDLGGTQFNSAWPLWKNDKRCHRLQQARLHLQSRAGSQARLTGFGKELLTSLVVRVRIRSKSSTNCLNVGLWEGTACQQSLIIMYLENTGLLGEFILWSTSYVAIGTFQATKSEGGDSLSQNSHYFAPLQGTWMDRNTFTQHVGRRYLRHRERHVSICFQCHRDF